MSFKKTCISCGIFLCFFFSFFQLSMSEEVAKEMESKTSVRLSSTIIIKRTVFKLLYISLLVKLFLFQLDFWFLLITCFN